MRRPSTLLALSLTLLALGAAGARGADLPDALLAKAQLTESDAKAIREFTDPAMTRLGAADTQASQQAREELLAPLRGNVSVAFRLKYSELIAPDLARLATGQNERVAFNALRIAGALATQECVQTLRAAIVDPRPSIRYGGSFGARRALEEVSAKRFALDAAQVQALVKSLSDQLKKEPEPGVVEGIVSAFDAVGPDPVVRAAALASMCDGIDAQAAAFGQPGRAGDPEAWAYAFQRAVKVAQAALLEQRKVGKLDDTLAKAASRLCGRMLAHLSSRLEAFKEGENHAGEIAALTDLASAAEGTLIFIDTNLVSRPSPMPQKIRDAFPDTAKVRAEAAKWIGPKGLLTQDPYSLKPLLP